VQKIAPQIPNIPRDIIAVAKDNPVSREVVNVGENGLKLLDGVGQIGKRSVDFITGQSGEVARNKALEVAGEEEIELAPIMLTEPNWTIPPTIESPDN